MIKYFNLIEKYYPKVNKVQLDKLRKLYDLYRKLNKKINLISRKDFENFYLHHIIHSLSLLNFINNKNIKIIDLGTGGGLPGLPLSIFLNKCEFYLIDSIKKKIDCVNTIIDELNINNIHTINSRVEDISIQSDIIVSRATSNINNILMWTKNSIKKRGVYLLLKGGNVDKELINIKLNHKIIELENIYSEEYFLNKKIIKIYK
tara:strand:- start:9675 stop:10286 length:612 start_codon:yes stop_codon:yes gene_type:complete